MIVYIYRKENNNNKLFFAEIARKNDDDQMDDQIEIETEKKKTTTKQLNSLRKCRFFSISSCFYCNSLLLFCCVIFK